MGGFGDRSTVPINRPVKWQVNGIDRRIKARRTTNPCYASSRRFQRAVHWGQSIGDSPLGQVKFGSSSNGSFVGDSQLSVHPFRGPCNLTCPQLDSAGFKLDYQLIHFGPTSLPPILNFIILVQALRSTTAPSRLDGVR